MATSDRQYEVSGRNAVRSTTDWIVRTTPDAKQPKKFSGPVAMAVFVAVLAAGVTGGATWLATAMASHNNAAVQMAEVSDYQ